MKRFALLIIACALALPALGSSMSGSGASVVCNGGEPVYCQLPSSTSQLAVTAINPGTYAPTGSTGVIQIDPETGVLFERVTDALTQHAYDPLEDYYAYTLNSSAMALTISNSVTGCSFGSVGSGFSGDSCRLLLTTNQGAHPNMFAFDDQINSPRFMNIQRIDGAAGTFPHGFTNGFAAPGLGDVIYTGGEFDHTAPAKLWTEVSNELESYDFTTNTANTTVFNFTTCPNLPAVIGTQNVDLIPSGDSTKFAYIRGGTSQDTAYIDTYYDSSTGNCYWLDTQNQTTGGTGIATQALNGAFINPPAAPAISVSPAGSTQYCVLETHQTQFHNPNGNSFGETLPSTEVCTTGAASGETVTITPAAISNPWSIEFVGDHVTNVAGAWPWREYVGTTGAETLQTGPGTNGGFGNGSTSFSFTPSTGGAAAPSSNTAGWNLHNNRMSKDGKYVILSYSQGSVQSYIWQPGTANVTGCITGDCAGHFGIGYGVTVNDAGNSYAPSTSASIGMVQRPLSSPSTVTLVNNVAVGAAADDGERHSSWNNAVPSDRMPFILSTSNSVSLTSDGTQSVTNNFIAPSAPYDKEIYLVAMDGSNKVWHVMHNHAYSCQVFFTGTGCPIGGNDAFAFQPVGQISADGKWFVFPSNWNGFLGQRGNGVSGGFGAYANSHAYASNATILDSNGNVQCSQSAFTTGSTGTPTWNTSAHGTTTDTNGTGVWENEGTPSSPANPIDCGFLRTDDVLVYIGPSR